MQLTLLSGYPDFVGRRQIFCGYGKGPEHYSHQTKDVLHVPPFGFVVDIVFPALSSSGDYRVEGFSEGVGARQTWTLKWIEVESGEEVGHGEDLSEETVQLGGFGGQF